MFLAAHAAQFKFLIFWVISPISKFFKILRAVLQILCTLQQYNGICKVFDLPFKQASKSLVFFNVDTVWVTVESHKLFFQIVLGISYFPSLV